MPSRTLTAAAVARIKPPRGGQADHFDKSYPGLVLRCSYGGAKTWAYVFRLHGMQRRITLGRWPGMSLADARTAWREAHGIVSQGESPKHRRPAAADTFAAVVAEWLKRDQAENRSAADVGRSIERTVLPRWHDRMIATIKRRDVIEAIDAVADRGTPIAARRLHAHLHRLFKWSVGRGIIESNPMADLPKPGAETRRDRALTDAELVVVWKAADELGWPFGQAIKLLILTGARRTEIGALRWSEIQGDAIRLEGARTKNSYPHHIPLSAAAGRVIETLPHIADSKYMLTVTGDTPISGWSKAKALLDRVATEIHGRALPDWRLHDLRRTVATGLQKLGFSLQVIEAVLGHIGGSRAGVVGVYQRHSFDPEKRQALDAWARHVEALVEGKPAAVVPLRGRRRG
jgi:integrase